MTAPWVLYPSEIMQMGFTELLPAIAVFAKSIKVLAMAAGGPKNPGARFSEKKPPNSLKLFGPATPLWVL